MDSYNGRASWWTRKTEPLSHKANQLIIIDRTNSQIETAIKGVNSLKNSINLNDPVGFMNIDTILKKRNLKNYLNKLRTNDLFIDIFNSIDRCLY